MGLTRRLALVAALLAPLAGAAGCRSVRTPSPTRAGVNVRDVIDPVAQAEAEGLLRVTELPEVGGQVAALQRERAAAEDPDFAARPPRNVLCLSGGGSYGAFSAGLLCGWTAAGTRPAFDVVTGISTGALIAPFAFLGPAYDGQMRQFYTGVSNRDVYRLRPVRGLVSEALADNAPLARLIDDYLTPDLMAAVACEHRRGRRLYVGTTELEARRFVVWDLGAIACRGREEDRELIKQVLLGSSAIPAFFPPSRIPVEIDGREFVERHGDGGVSQGLFFRPPYTPPDQRAELRPHSLAGTNVWCVVAGKLYAEPDTLKPRVLALAGGSILTVLYAQTRGDLQRIYTLCLLTGMEYHLTAIPADYPGGPGSSAEFDREKMTELFGEGYRLAVSGSAWRKTPPGTGPGEAPLGREGTCLTAVPRGP